MIPKDSLPSNPYLDRVKLVEGDIIEQDVDAVISVIPQNLEYSGSLNNSLMKGAGERLDNFVVEHFYRPFPGDVYAIPAFNLPCKYLIFAVLPTRKDDLSVTDKHLIGSCRKAIEMAQSMDLDSIAIPPIASGKKGFPKPKAARLIIRAIAERINQDIKEVRVVCPDRETLEIFHERLEAILQAQ